MSEQMRKEFEAWFSKNYNDRLDRNMPDKSYNNLAAYYIWEGWQAALATQPQAPQVDGELLDFLEESTATTSHDFVKWIVDVPLKWAGGESEIFSGSTLREAIIAAKVGNAISAPTKTPEELE